MTRRETRCDVAIVGAGIAGLYCAWRLLKADRTLRVRIVEQSPRPGGRLMSVDLLRDAGAPKVELGGMRFTDSQQLVNRLVRDLAADEPRAARELTPVDFTFHTTLAFLRQKRVCDPTGRAIPSHVPYQLRDKETTPLAELAARVAKRGIETALDLVLKDPRVKGTRCARLTATLRANLTRSALSPEEWREWQQTASIDGIRLCHIGVWNLLQRCLLQDEFLLLHSALGYESLLANSNATQAIPVFLADFAVTAYHTLYGGMEALPRALVAWLRRLDPGILSLSTAIRRIERRPDGTFHLFARMPDKSDQRMCTARTVILAVPQAGLEQIDLAGFNPAAARRFREHDLQQVTGHPAVKLYLMYDRPWWEKDVGLRARAVTDLPVRQVYYLGDHESRKALVMASYSDDHYVDFWDPLIDDPAVPAKDQARHVASPTILTSAHEQLQQIHGRRLPSSPLAGRVKEWAHAWHFWKVHTQPWLGAQKMVRPFAGAELYTCGEAYSLEQGWIEGALKSAERVLARIGVSRPAGIVDYLPYVKG
jgi:monoamine oxidase